MSLPRVMAQVMITGTQIIGRAFIEAYQIAAQNSAKNAAAAAASKTADEATRKTGIALDEAFQILNVSKESIASSTREELEGEIVKKYDTLFKLNDPSGSPPGSHYLQSKIVRARERLELELQKMKSKEGGDGNESTTNDDSGKAI